MLEIERSLTENERPNETIPEKREYCAESLPSQKCDISGELFSRISKNIGVQNCWSLKIKGRKGKRDYKNQGKLPKFSLWEE